MENTKSSLASAIFIRVIILGALLVGVYFSYQKYSAKNEAAGHIFVGAKPTRTLLDSLGASPCFVSQQYCQYKYRKDNSNVVITIRKDTISKIERY